MENILTNHNQQRYQQQ